MRPVYRPGKPMHGTFAICNLLLIVTTCAVSVWAFADPSVEEKLIFDPESILAEKQYHRLITSAFLHADFGHLLLNMFSLYLFGNMIEFVFGKADLLLIYFGAILGGSLLSLYVHRHHEYRAYGASGGVCGVIFAYLLFFPGASLYQIPLPFPIPAWLYAILFIVGSFYRMKLGRDNIGHDAHLGGAMLGLLIAGGLEPQTVRYNWRIFLLVLGLCAGILIYLWRNPMMLRGATASFHWPRFRRRRSEVPEYKKKQLEIDAILEKIATSGKESLTAEETALLQEESEKFRRRGDSKKPESGLAI